MNEYIFYTAEGLTYPPREDKEVENCQVLGRAKGKDAEEAKQNLLEQAPWIVEYGFDVNEIICKQIFADNIKQEIFKVLQYMFDDECKHYFEFDKPDNHIFSSILKLRDSINAEKDFPIDDYI